MTPKEKAKELFDKMHDPFDMDKYLAKYCAFVAIDEIIEQWEYIDTYIADGKVELNPNLKYWHEVKKELEIWWRV